MASTQNIPKASAGVATPAKHRRAQLQDRRHRCRLRPYECYAGIFAEVEATEHKQVTA